jgi:hypothetical protein
MAPGASAGQEGAREGTAQFAWHSGADASQGEIQATLPDGRLFSGKYLQVRSTTEVNTAGLYYSAWSGPGWAGGPWYGGAPGGFVTEYSGQAVALLDSADGTQMRCKFALNTPERGMAGGGMGTCQLSDNEEIFGAQLKSQ